MAWEMWANKAEGAEWRPGRYLQFMSLPLSSNEMRRPVVLGNGICKDSAQIYLRPLRAAVSRGPLLAAW